MTTGAMTVIVPTFNRCETLKLCLEALERQTVRDFQVIVIDDGSTDATRDFLQSVQRNTPLQLRWFTQPNSGPARGRNLALSKTTTPLALLIGDDILADVTLVETHMEFHKRNSGTSQLALGWTRWDETHQEITAFMRWYENLQFDYRRLLAGQPPGWQHAYTSNLSFKTSLLRENAFDERFRAAAWEDVELAYRLQVQQSFHLTFLPQARARHIHPTTFVAALRRAQVLGKAEKLFHTLHPGARPEPARDFASSACTLLSRHVVPLWLLTKLAERKHTPGALHSLVLRARQEREYRNTTVTPTAASSLDPGSNPLR